MTKLQVLYVKIDAFWDSIPAPLKVPLYQAISAGLLLLADYLSGEVNVITREMWLAIWSAFVANEVAVIGEYLRKKFGNIETLKEQYNKGLMDR
jgi:hypothetical protein